ncbi:response regulator [Massilia norwichensis]|uniref:Response regulator n=1 Tax=Massilia norwichensis TaxID=1442366 RepID=A0ABT2A753_9BURK|nr:response regulator [Massilia norwichensis]
MDDSKLKHILVVDDEEAVGYVFERYLSIKGYRVSVAYSGEQALDAFRADAPDVVITDYKMPGMNGDELLRRLRALQPGLPAVMISANPIEVGPTLEQVRFFPKPVSLEILVEHLETML